MGAPSEFDVRIAGGSLSGIAAAVELSLIGARVSVDERSVGRVDRRGAGLIVQPEVDALLRRLGTSAERISVPLQTRQQFDLNGELHSFEAPQLMTSWETLHQTLLAHLDPSVLHLGRVVEGVDDDSEGVRVEFSGGGRESTDLLIGADGVHSAVRAAVGAAAQPSYAGYVAWRGLEPESAIPEEVLHLLVGSYTYFTLPGMQFLAFLVPGPEGQLTPRDRRVNWIWYVNMPEEAKASAMIAADGSARRSFLPADAVREPVREALVRLAEATLPAPLRDLVGLSSMFAQPIVDLDRSALRDPAHPRVLFVGDAVGTVRPHTGSGTAKAIGDVAELASALTGWRAGDPLPVDRLAAWEDHRLKHLSSLQWRGRRLAGQSMLGGEFGTSYLGELADLTADAGVVH